MTGHTTAASADRDEPSAAVREVARVEATSRKVTTGEAGRRIVWRIWGSGDPVVLLHGGFGSWTHWIRNVEMLSRNAMVLAPDMPGFGDSDSLADQGNARPFAEALWHGLDTILSDERRVALVGFSFGGPIAGTMAHMRPDQVSRLVLVGSGGLKLSRPDTEPLSRWRALVEPNEILEAHQRNLEILMIHDHRGVDALAVYLQAANAGRARAASRPVSRGTDLPSLLGAVDVPIAGIWGFHDATAAGFLHERESLLRQLDQDAEFIVIEGAGHWVQYEAAGEFNQALRRILATGRMRGEDKDKHQGERG